MKTSVKNKKERDFILEQAELIKKQEAKEKILEQNREYRKKNLEKYRDYHREWYKNNREKAIAYRAKYKNKIRKKNTSINPVKAQENSAEIKAIQSIVKFTTFIRAAFAKIVIFLRSKRQLKINLKPDLKAKIETETRAISKEDLKNYLSAKQAADLLGISVQALEKRRWKQKNGAGSFHVPFYNYRSHIYYKKTEVEDYLKSPHAIVPRKRIGKK